MIIAHRSIPHSSLSACLLTVAALGAAGCSELKTREVIFENVRTGIGTAPTFEYSKIASEDYFKTRYYKADNRAEERNRILFELMELVDAEFAKFATELRSDRAYKDIFVKITSLSLTGAASISGKAAANILAAVDTGLKGASEAVDVSAFHNHATELLINKMRAERALVAQDIYAGMNKTDKDYPLQAGIRDVGKYKAQGSVTAALAALSASTSEEAKKNVKDAVDKKNVITVQ